MERKTELMQYVAKEVSKLSEDKIEAVYFAMIEALIEAVKTEKTPA